MGTVSGITPKYFVLAFPNSRPSGIDRSSPFEVYGKINHKIHQESTPVHKWHFRLQL